MGLKKKGTEISLKIQVLKNKTKNKILKISRYFKEVLYSESVSNRIAHIYKTNFKSRYSFLGTMLWQILTATLQSRCPFCSWKNNQPTQPNPPQTIQEQNLDSKLRLFLSLYFTSFLCTMLQTNKSKNRKNYAGSVKCKI